MPGITLNSGMRETAVLEAPGQEPPHLPPLARAQSLQPDRQLLSTSTGRVLAAPLRERAFFWETDLEAVILSSFSMVDVSRN
jgi:hypothetical protein